MFKKELVEIKDDGYEIMKTVQDPQSGKDLKLIQDIRANIPGRSCVIIQNQAVNINVTNNIVNMLKKIDSLIERVGNNGFSDMDVIDNHDSTIKGLFKSLWESGANSQTSFEYLRVEYLKYCLSRCDNNMAKVARRLGENRTTITQFVNRKRDKHGQSLQIRKSA